MEYKECTVLFSLVQAHFAMPKNKITQGKVLMMNKKLFKKRKPSPNPLLPRQSPKQNKRGW
jgi:hypothetical protein